MAILNGAKIIVYNKQIAKYLLVLRDIDPAKSHPNTWGMLGGAIEQGETPLQAITRELKEETDLPVSNIKFLYSQPQTIVRGGKVINSEVNIFAGETDQSDLQSVGLREGQRLQYFSSSEIQSMTNVTPGVKYFFSTPKRFLNIF